MSRHLELLDGLLQRIAAGELAPGGPVPSVRELARREGVSTSTAARVHAELARQGVIGGGPRRRSRVAADGAVAARRLLHGGRALRLAGSDDPLLDRLLEQAPAVERVGGRGSFFGLSALWSHGADAAALHLRHRDGTYNGPFARSVLAGRDPQIVSLWRREQGLLVAPGNPLGIDRVGALDGAVVAQRAPGTGTQALLHRLIAEAGGDPGALAGPVHGSHLEVATAVAAGTADAGVGTRAAAAALGLDFVHLTWEPFELALPGPARALVEPLIEAIRPRAEAVARELGGYEVVLAGFERA